MTVSGQALKPRCTSEVSAKPTYDLTLDEVLLQVPAATRTASTTVQSWSGSRPRYLSLACLLPCQQATQLGEHIQGFTCPFVLQCRHQLLC